MDDVDDGAGDAARGLQVCTISSSRRLSGSGTRAVLTCAEICHLAADSESAARLPCRERLRNARDSGTSSPRRRWHPRCFDILQE
jgi:hypothetical protein